MKEKETKPEETTKEAGDIYELTQSTIRTYTLDKNITRAWTLASLEPQEKTFIRQQYMLAKIIKDFIKDPEYSQKTYELLLSEIETILTLSRNKKSNTMLMGVLGKLKEVIGEEETKEGTFKKFMGKLFPHKNEEKETDEAT